MSGLVSVYVRNPEDQKKYQRLMRASLDPSSSRRLVRSSLALLSATNCCEPTISDCALRLFELPALLQSTDFGPVNYGAKVVTLTPGATFGELCLIEPDSKRSATVIVDPQAQIANFIVLTAASYLRMTRSQTIEGTITDHISFLQHMLMFRKWSKMRACLGFFITAGHYWQS